MPASLRLAAASVLLGAIAACRCLPPAHRRASYTRTLDHEMALRPALGAAKVTPATLAEAAPDHQGVERLASTYPGSGYTDNALLQAAKLAADVWAATGDDSDRVVAVIYKRLVAGYPSSSLLSRARPELARLGARDVFAPACRGDSGGTGDPRPSPGDRARPRRAAAGAATD